MKRDPKKSAKFERCVRKVKKSRSAVNPWAVCHAALGRRARRDAVPMPKRNPEAEREMKLGFLEAVWLDSYMDWAEEHGLGYRSGHIPQHVRDLSDIPQAPPRGAKKLAEKYASLLVKLNHATLTQICDRAAKAEGGSIDPKELGFLLAMQSRGHGIGWTDDHAAFNVTIPSAEWYAYGRKGKVQVEGYVSERFAHKIG